MSSKAVEPTGEVHPVADLFPMMTDDELDDLAADIKANGLLHPIVLDENGVLIDGRNRMAGCLRAGVEPTFTALNGHDPVAFIISSNVARRHLSKGQAAMAVAQSERFVTNQSVRCAAKEIGVSHSRIVYAKVVLDYAPDLVDDVRHASVTLDKAYEEARNRKLAAEGRENSLARLQSEAPDLAALVQEERLTLSEGLGALDKRIRDERARVRSVTENLNTALLCLDPCQMDSTEAARSFLLADPAFLAGSAEFSSARARRCLEVLRCYVDLKENEENGKA